jgi:Pentapeptide repeats (8 copies)
VTPNIHYKDQEIVGERLELPKGPLYWLGPNLTLRDCTLVISVASRWLTLMSGQFIDCSIQAKSELKNKRWARMNFKGCRFKGRFRGNDFGFVEDDLDKWRLGGIENCDFSEAMLDGCRFYNCDMSTIRLPRWPCFTFMDPVRRAAELAREAWPGSFGPVIIEGLSTQEASVVALTYHAPSVAERRGTTAEALRAVLERVPSVVM